MQCAVQGKYITFETVEQLQTQLATAVKSGYTIRIFDEDVGG